MEQIINDYLTPHINQIRHSIKGIDDSYNNDWDIYAELIQNAVDAIRQSDIGNGHIELEVDCPNRAIKIMDSGIGINPDELPDLLKPFGTNKYGDNVAIGEKGVGLKFVIFSSNFFRIKSGNTTGSAVAEIQNANSWKKSRDDKPLPLKFQKVDDQFTGTKVEIGEVDNENIFNLSFEQFKYVLRTRTAIGSTKLIWGNDKEIDFTITYTDINSISFQEQIPFKYWLITDEVPENSKINLDDFEEWIRQGDRTDQDKMAKLKDKIIFKKGQFEHSNWRLIKYFACFVPKRRVWNDLSISLHLTDENKLNDDNWLEQYYYCKINNGIFISVKGMPTGISIDHPSTGFAGYWANFFMLFEDPFVNFDIGRKSIHGNQANIHRNYAREIFNEFLKYVTKYVAGDISFEPTEWDRDEIFSEVETLVDLNIDGLSLKKAPSDQEASVAAIFFECIGSRRIQNIIPLICGYRSKYDLYALWGRKKIIIEFKSRLRNLARDFNDARKMFDEIDCVVCWEITDTDRQVMHDMGINLEEISTSVFARDTKKIPHSTHIMNLSGFTNPLYVIDLKRLLTS